MNFSTFILVLGKDENRFNKVGDAFLHLKNVENHAQKGPCKNRPMVQNKGSLTDSS